MKKLGLVAVLLLALTACGANKRSVPLKVHSDPLGAYALMQIKYKGQEDSDWIFLGPTPVVINKSIVFDGATSISMKMIKPGYHDQMKTWSAKDFRKEYKRQKKISWVPVMVKQ